MQTLDPVTGPVIAALRDGRPVLLSDDSGAEARLYLVVAAKPLPEDQPETIGHGPIRLALPEGAEIPAGVAAHPSCAHPLLRAAPGGVLQRRSLAEASIDLMRLASLAPMAFVRELVDAPPRDLPRICLSDLVAHRLHHEPLVVDVAQAELPSAHADRPFRLHAFQSRIDGTEHLAAVAPGVADGPPLVRLHSECLTGDALGSLRCDCGEQLQESMRRLAGSPGGILVYLRGQEGRGIGLANKIRAYALQDGGLDTVEANRALGLPDDARDYAQAAQILRALGHDRVRLLTNNPAKAEGLQSHGITVVSVEPLALPSNPHNAHYLATKARKMRHALPDLSVPLPHQPLT